MRLQVFLSHSGACSRRRALQLTRSGRVRVNGSIVIEPSYQINPAKDSVFLGVDKISLKENIYILLNKPKGVTTTRKDRFAEKTILDLLPNKYKHLFPVGRLDKDSTGLLMLTNDGDLCYKLTHPSFNIQKVYIAKLDKELSEGYKEQIQKGIYLDDRLTSSCKVIKLDDKRVKITINEGRKRQIRRMLAMFKYKVMDLKRVALGNLDLGNLAIGCWRVISDRELFELREILKRSK